MAEAAAAIINVSDLKLTGQPAPELKKTLSTGDDVRAGNAARYVCPMGEYEGDRPGQCPKCGMTLVEKK